MDLSKASALQNHRYHSMIEMWKNSSFKIVSYVSWSSTEIKRWILYDVHMFGTYWSSCFVRVVLLVFSSSWRHRFWKGLGLSWVPSGASWKAFLLLLGRLGRVLRKNMENIWIKNDLIFDGLKTKFQSFRRPRNLENQHFASTGATFFKK